MRTVYRARPQLRERRERGPRPMTQRELGAAAGVSYQSIHRIETGLQRCRPAVSIAIAEALGVERDVLFDADTIPSPVRTAS